MAGSKTPSKATRKLWSVELTPELDKAIDEIVAFQERILPLATGSPVGPTKSMVLRQLITLGVLGYWADRDRLVGLMKLAGVPNPEQEADALHERSVIAQIKTGKQASEEHAAGKSLRDGHDPINVASPDVVRRKRGRPPKMGSGVGTKMGKR